MAVQGHRKNQARNVVFHRVRYYGVRRHHQRRDLHPCQRRLDVLAPAAEGLVRLAQYVRYPHVLVRRDPGTGDGPTAEPRGSACFTGRNTSARDDVPGYQRLRVVREGRPRGDHSGLRPRRTPVHRCPGNDLLRDNRTPRGARNNRADRRGIPVRPRLPGQVPR